VPSAQDIQTLFQKVAPRYDFLNHLLSGGLDFYWRRVLAQAVKKQHPDGLLDLATGSGDVALALHRHNSYRGICVGADFCLPMLQEASKKNLSTLCVADGLSLPFTDGSFAAVTISFGLRNLIDRPAGLREMARVLKSGGCLYVLEFSRPHPWLRPFYFFFLRHLMPRLVRCFTPADAAYVYLCDSIAAFPPQKKLAAMIQENGFTQVRYHNLSFGIVALHIAQKMD
jgi:demethylmenaquinone methyltransferase / 2-methoxy-6-polyprenyl-1,4-benzoquinol methylase